LLQTKKPENRLHATSISTPSGLQPVKLGKALHLQHIPFSELVIPWEAAVNANAEPEQGASSTRSPGPLAHAAITPDSAKALKAMKQHGLEDLKASIGQFGLLKPLEVAELPEQLEFFFGKGKYAIIDGQRRYFAIRELLRLPTEHDERDEKESLATHPAQDHVKKAETQAKEKFERLTIRDYVLVPCLVYPHKTYLQMMRHSTEGSRFTAKPPRIYRDVIEEMLRQGTPDLTPDDLTNLWETRKKIEDERQAIEKTLQEIRHRNGVESSGTHEEQT
jgi:hypothetical protein